MNDAVTAADDLALLTGAAQQAGRIALRHFRRNPRFHYKPDGAGPVSEADLAVNDHLHQVLRAARPGYGWLSEESDDDPARLDAGRVFIIDPIDGTRAFLQGDRAFSHSLAIAQTGQVIAAVVHLPARGLTYAAALGRGSWLNGQRITVSAAADLTGARVLTNKPAMEAQNWIGAVPDLSRHHRPSLAWRLGLIAEGRFDACLTLRPAWEWDIAAGHLLVAEAGGQVSTAAGDPARYNNPEPRLPGLVAAGPGLHRALLARLSHAQPG